MFAETFQSTVRGPLPRFTVQGAVASIDDGLAQVFIGDGDEEWFFPLTTLPAGSQEGSAVLFTRDQFGRYSAVSLVVDSTNTVLSIQDRLDRPMSRRRTGEMRKVERPTDRRSVSF